MSQIYPNASTRLRNSNSQAAANTAAVADAISARAQRVAADLQALQNVERIRPLSREEQDRADWLRWLSNRLNIELTTLQQELATLHGATSQPPAQAGQSTQANRAQHAA